MVIYQYVENSGDIIYTKFTVGLSWFSVIHGAWRVLDATDFEVRVVWELWIVLRGMRCGYELVDHLRE